MLSHANQALGKWASTFYHHAQSSCNSIDPKHANRGKNMAALIEEEGLDEDGHPVKHLIPRRRRQKRKRKQTKNTKAGNNTGGKTGGKSCNGRSGGGAQ